MENIRFRPEGKFTWEAEWQQLYILTEHWKSDIQFYKDDVKFLYNLVDKYFIGLTHKDSLDEMRELAKNLSDVSRKCESLLNNVAKHLSHLSELMEEPFKYDSNQFRNEHEKLEEDFATFVKDFRETKKEIFKITEQVIENENKKRLTT